MIDADRRRLRSGMWVSYEGRVVKVVTVTRTGGGTVTTMSGRFDNGAPVRFDADPADGVLDLADVHFHGWLRP